MSDEPKAFRHAWQRRGKVHRARPAHPGWRGRPLVALCSSTDFYPDEEVRDVAMVPQDSRCKYCFQPTPSPRLPVALGWPIGSGRCA